MSGGKGGAAVDRALLDPEGIFPARLADDRAALADCASDLWTIGAKAREERLNRMTALAHRLAGAAGTFGYHTVSDAALALEEQILERWPGDAPRMGHAAVRQALEGLIDALDEALATNGCFSGKSGSGQVQFRK
jgi:HPt (histidine-containing phosphotransfer) domain-containing protein